ncbi:hypothetical protein M378DRAFT_173307 [Amanita muscaria Koide BX008]|uniref:Uncharacterized protein n=1 Tax=Amanita muscaria (strain Koide BX008) TaxID=946122 RepID=A0A0C2WI58_AMAMK|nr:hypothetical protein M378DRAFT_173307 [Amanita muscaria Koide BX008]
MVVAISPSKIDEIRRADDDTLSPLEVARDSLHANLTIGPERFDATKGPPTRNIDAMFADVQDEIATAFEDYSPIKRDGTFASERPILLTGCRMD